MRRLSYSYRYIQEVVYLKDNVPQCSSLENKSRAVAFPAAMKVTEDGYRARLTTDNDLGIQRFMAALGSENYVVMVDPATFIDVVPFGSWPIDVAIIGADKSRIVTSSGTLPEDILQNFQQDNATTHLQKRALFTTPAPSPALGITVVSWASTLPLKNMAPTGAYLAPGGNSYRSADRRLCSAYFTSFAVSPSSVAGGYPAP